MCLHKNNAFVSYGVRNILSYKLLELLFPLFIMNIPLIYFYIMSKKGVNHLDVWSVIVCCLWMTWHTWFELSHCTSFFFSSLLVRLPFVSRTFSFTFSVAVDIFLLSLFCYFPSTFCCFTTLCFKMLCVSFIRKLFLRSFY